MLFYRGPRILNEDSFSSGGCEGALRGGWGWRSARPAAAVRSDDRCGRFKLQHAQSSDRFGRLDEGVDPNIMLPAVTPDGEKVWTTALGMAAGRVSNANMVTTLLHQFYFVVASVLVHLLLKRNFGSAVIGVRLAGRGQLEAATLLLENGADPDQPTSDGATPLMAAAASGHTAILWLLADFEAILDAPAPENGATALHIACAMNEPSCVEALYQAGCNKVATNDAGDTAKQIAERKG